MDNSNEFERSYERISLGTVQFGLKYGVVNSAGIVSDDELAAILQSSSSLGIKTLDTAVAYGESESRLGKLGVKGWDIGTKIPPVPVGLNRKACIDWVVSQIERSLERLQVQAVESVLVHRIDDLFGEQGDSLFDGLAKAKSLGLCAKVGLSLYSQAQVYTLSARYPIDLIQAPLNVFDQSLALSGCLDHCSKNGIEVHVRSVFLQGLLLSSALNRPAYFAKWSDLWSRWDSWLRLKQLKAIDACMQFALSNPLISRVVVGVESESQLREICSSVRNSIDCVSDMRQFATDDLQLTDPTLWPKN
jgi:aryl-alcohol dehydrogenase-like predicted oxidoreductase